jgi:acyl carrier protein
MIENTLGVDYSDITEDLHINNDLGADSLDAVEIIMNCEAEFQITIPDEDAQEVQTVKDLIDKVEEILK